jgi:hypothetical protein
MGVAIVKLSNNISPLASPTQKIKWRKEKGVVKLSSNLKRRKNNQVRDPQGPEALEPPDEF